MVQGVTLAHKGLAPSRLIPYFRKVKMPMPGTHSTYKKLAVQWLNKDLCSVSSFVVADSLVLRNRQLLLAAKRYAQCYDDSEQIY